MASLSLTASLSLSDPTIIIITQPPSSRKLDLFTCFVLFLFLILMVDQSRNPYPFKPKPKVDRSEGWLDPFLCYGGKGWSEPPPALAEVNTDKEDAMFSIYQMVKSLQM